MPLIFLLTYIGLTHFIYSQTKNKAEKIPLVLKIVGLLTFFILYVFITMYLEESRYGEIKVEYLYSFYVLAGSYFGTFVIYLMKYRKILAKNKENMIYYCNKGTIEKFLDKFYLIIIAFTFGFYFLESSFSDILGHDGLEKFFYICIIFSSIYTYFEDDLLARNRISNL